MSGIFRIKYVSYIQFHIERLKEQLGLPCEDYQHTCGRCVSVHGDWLYSGDRCMSLDVLKNVNMVQG